MIHKFKVCIEGNNFLIRIEDIIAKHGFFTIRFFETEESNIAEILALRMVSDELKSVILNDPSDPPVINVNEVCESYDFVSHIVPGSGFTWYKED